MDLKKKKILQRTKRSKKKQATIISRQCRILSHNNQDSRDKQNDSVLRSDSTYYSTHNPLWNYGNVNRMEKETTDSGDFFFIKSSCN